MRDATAHAAPAQVLENGVLRAPHVQEHRQGKLTGQLQLSIEKPLLTRPRFAGRDIGVKEIKADFAYGDKPVIVEMIRDRCAKHSNGVVLTMSDRHRVDAERVSASRGPMGQFAYPREVAGVDSGNQNAVYAGGDCARDDRFAIRVVLRGVQMAVRIEEHRAVQAVAVDESGRALLSGTRRPASICNRRSASRASSSSCVTITNAVRDSRFTCLSKRNISCAV